MTKTEIKKEIGIEDFVKTAARYEYQAYKADKRGVAADSNMDINIFLAICKAIENTLFESYAVKTMKEAQDFTDSEIQKEFVKLEKKYGYV